MATTEVAETTTTEWEVADAAAVAADFAQYEAEAGERRLRGAVVKPPEGKSTWRFLPPLKGRKIWYFRCWTHNVNNKVLEEIVAMLAALPEKVRADLAKEFSVADIAPVSLGDGFAATYCNSKMSDAPCLYCKIASALYKLARSSDALKHAGDLASEIQSKEEYFTGAVRVDDQDEMKRGPRILQLPLGVFEKVNKFFSRPTTDEELGGDFTHPDKGFNIVIDRVVDKKTKVTLKNGKTIDKTSYEVATGRSPSKIKDREWLGRMHDLTKARALPDESAVRNALEGGARPAAPAQGLPPEAEKKQLAAAATREPGDDGDEPTGDPAEWIEDPEAAGDYDTRANLRAKGRKV